MDAEGHELAWFDRLDQVTQRLQEQLRAAIAEREFLPEIQRLKAVSSLVTPSVWTVDTDRGEARFMLKGEEDIRRLTGKTLIVSDVDGVQYLIRDPLALDKHSRKLLDRFM
jgi:acyl-CoA synthetase (NDP forming)